MQHQPATGHAGGQSHVQFASGGHIDRHSLFVGQPGHGPAEEGLGRVGHVATPSRHRLSTPAPQVKLVVDEGRGADLLAELEEVDSADRQMPQWVNDCAVRQEGHGQGARRRTSGQEIGG